MLKNEKKLPLTLYIMLHVHDIHFLVNKYIHLKIICLYVCTHYMNMNLCIKGLSI
jgi:hypothetical protein